jgi:hypothetical protein
MPPEALVPAAVQDLKVQQSGDAFRITWSAPGKEKGGRPLRDLAGFRLTKRIILGNGTDCSTCEESWKLLAEVDADKPGEGGRSGGRFIIFDRDVPVGRTSQYRLLVLSKSGGFSAPATSPLTKSHPPVPAPAVAGEVLPASVKLAFTFTPPAGARLAGFNVYRTPEKAAPALLPLNPAPLTGTVWEDTQVEFGRSYRYSVAALVEIDGQTMESVRSAELELLFSLQELR